MALKPTLFVIRGDFYCRQTCAEDYDPVCASDGQTYPNQCLMKNASCDRADAELTVSAYGTCEFPDLPVGEAFYYFFTKLINYLFIIIYII